MDREENSEFEEDTDADEIPENLRPFKLAVAPFQFEVKPANIRSVFRFDGFEGNVEVISLHTDNFFGIPWDAFMAGEEPPQAWIDNMTAIKAAVDDLGAPIYLSLTPLGGVRNRIAAKVLERNGELEIDGDWRPVCYDFIQGEDHEDIFEAYLAYVRWMVDFFEPQWLTHGIEINLYDVFCPEQYVSLIPLLNAVYDQEKALRPDLPIFPTLTVDHMWLEHETLDCSFQTRICLRANLEKLATLKRDRIGLSAYPVWHFNEVGGPIPGYFSAFAEETGEPLMVGETGVTNRVVEVPFPTTDDPCLMVVASSDAAQIEYLEYLLNEAETLNMDLVVWWSLVDFLPEHMLEGCPCTSPWPWCIVYQVMADSNLLHAFIMWGGMGILDYELQPKAIHETWQSWLARPVQTE